MVWVAKGNKTVLDFVYTCARPLWTRIFGACPLLSCCTEPPSAEGACGFLILLDYPFRLLFFLVAAHRLRFRLLLAAGGRSKSDVFYPEWARMGGQNRRPR